MGEAKGVVDRLYFELQNTARLLSCQMSQLGRPRFNKRAPFSNLSTLTLSKHGYCRGVGWFSEYSGGRTSQSGKGGSTKLHETIRIA
jgi:hypothetical protein